MKLLKILMLFVVMSVSAPLLASPTCSKTKYKLLDKTVSFGMSLGRAEEALKAKYQSQARIFQQRNFLIVDFHRPVNNLGKIFYLAINDKITRIMFSYSNDFTVNFGGTDNLFSAVFEKMQGAYGKAKDASYDDDASKAKVFWGSDNGAVLQLIGDNETIEVRVDCNALEEEAKAQRAKSVNFGF